MDNYMLIKQELLALIEETDGKRCLFTRNPKTDFSRVKKWTFAEIMRFMISMQGESLNCELLKYFHCDHNMPTKSSFNQRRAQILPDAFEYLFHRFTDTVNKDKLFQGYRLLACDGSTFTSVSNPEDTETHICWEGASKGYNQMHLNALYNLKTKIYQDAIIQPIHGSNENAAFCNMIDRYQGPQKTVFIADRGYESYNILAHILEKEMFYLIRVKDVEKKGGILYHLLDNSTVDMGSFDIDRSITLTRKQTKEIKADPQTFRYLPLSVHFDFLDKITRPFYEMNLRIVRFPLSDHSYESILTNLPRDLFPNDMIKELYHMRWGIETSFRELKYAVGLNNFHSKKADFIKQEIWARLIFYNFSEAIIARVAVRKSNRKKTYLYQLNHTNAIHICRMFLSIRKEAPPDLDFLISRELLPVRPGRSDPRKVKIRSAVSFLYRVA